MDNVIKRTDRDLEVREESTKSKEVATCIITA
jgi:hypothetical protein